MIHLLAGAVVAAIGALVAGAVIVTLSERVTKSVTSWLVSRQLNTGMLLDAWMHLERAGTKFRSTVYFRHRSLHGTYQLTLDELVSPDQIDDPAVLAALQARGTASADVMHLFN